MALTKLRDYQTPAVHAIVAVDRGIVKAPAGSGKTVIAAAAIGEAIAAATRPLNVIWYGHTTEQCEQAKQALWNMGLTFSPRIASLEIVCYQSARSAKGFDIAILDECHHIASPEFRKVLDGYTGFRWGFSATPDRADELKDDVYSLIGPIVYEVPRDILVEQGNLAPAKVYFHAPNEKDSLAPTIEDDAQVRAEKMEYAVNHTAMKLLTQPMDRVLTMSGQAPLILQLETNGVETRLPMKTWRDLAKKNAKQLQIFDYAIKTAARKELLSRARWLACQELGVFVNEVRNAKIVELARQHLWPHVGEPICYCGIEVAKHTEMLGCPCKEQKQSKDSVLILVGSIEHGKLLQASIPESLVLHSKMGAKKRREAMEALRSGDLRCGIATSLADEGLDIPRLNTIILAAAGRSESKAEQRTGRVLRSFFEKTHGTVHDFWDWQHPLLLAQARARAKVYAGLKYEFVGTEEILPTVLKAVGISLHPAIGMRPTKKSAKTSNKEVASTSELNEVPSTSPPVNTNTNDELLPTPATERLAGPDSTATGPEAAAPLPAPVPDAGGLVHAARAHARFSPSSLKGRLICPGFISDPDGDKKYADRGSLGHEAVEKDDLTIIKDDPQLVEAAQTCINYKKRICAGKEVHQELKLYICDVAGDPQYGHTDLVAIEPSGKKADMIDWKFAYNPYEADGPQFWSYTLGVFNRWPSIEELRVHVVHPFLGMADVVTFTRNQSTDLMLKVRSIIARTLQNRPEDYRITDQCRYCGMANKCRKLAELATQIGAKYAPEITAPEDITFHGSEVSDPTTIARLLQLAPIVKKAAGGWTKRGLELYDKGVNIPGYEISKKGGKRSVASANLAFELVRDNFVPQLRMEDFLEHCTVTATGLDTLVKAASPKGKKAENVEALACVLEDADAMTYGAEGRFLRAKKKNPHIKDDDDQD